MSGAEHERVLHVWFRELDPGQWWMKDAAVDEATRARFGALHRRAARCEPPFPR